MFPIFTIVGDIDVAPLITTLGAIVGHFCIQYLQTTEIVMENHLLLYFEPLLAHSCLQHLLQWEEVTVNHLLPHLKPLSEVKDTTIEVVHVSSLVGETLHEIESLTAKRSFSVPAY